MRTKAVALLLTLCACKRDVPVRPDPFVVDAALKDDLAPARILRQGRVIDRREGRVLSALSKEAPQHEDGTHFVDQKGILHAVDLAAAGERWAKKPPFIPYALASTRSHAVVARDKDVAVYDEAGVERTLSFPASIGSAIARRNDVLLLEDGDRLHRLDLGTAKATLFAKLPFKASGWQSGLRPLPDEKTVCAIGDPHGALEIACFDELGSLTTRTTLDLHEPSDPKSMSFGIRWSDARYVLFGVGPFFVGATKRAAVVRLADGAIVSRMEENLATAVEREDGTLAGVLAVEPELRFFDLNGKRRWNVPSPAPHDESASAIARGDRMYVDVFPPISSGSTLVALDLASGAKLWAADVEMLPIAHSEYFNEVRISFFERRIELKGDEASVWTYQLFDESTGKRLLAASQQTW